MGAAALVVIVAVVWFVRSNRREIELARLAGNAAERLGITGPSSSTKAARQRRAEGRTVARGINKVGEAAGTGAMMGAAAGPVGAVFGAVGGAALGFFGQDWQTDWSREREAE